MIPINLATMNLPAIIWKVLGFLVSWKEKENMASVERVALGMDGLYIESAAGVVEVSEDKGKSFTEKDGTKKFYYPGLMASAWYDTATYKFTLTMTGLGEQLVDYAFGTCVDPTYTMSLMGKIYAIC
jgi:hypothetical protein